MTTPNISRIVLTGGPCGGKSTALTRISTHLTRQGVCVYLVPEASTLLLTGGMLVKDAPDSHMVIFQRGIVRVQLTMEEAFGSFARTVGKPAVLLCDRGVVDGAAYLPATTWSALLAEEHLDEVELREQRYTAVIHLVTAAVDLEENYGTHTNAVRYEDIPGARAVDARLQQAWQGHPRHFIIGTDRDFEAKMHRVVCAVSEVVGVARPEVREK
jgi:predicted ATPase